MSTKGTLAGLLLTVSLGLTPLLSQATPDRQQQVAAHLSKAQEYLAEKQPKLAIPEFQAVLALDPNNLEARGNLGVLLFFEGDYAKAAPELRAAVKMKPDLWKLQALLGMSERRVGEIDSAQSDLEDALPNLKEKKLHIETGLELVQIYSDRDDLEKAAQIVASLRQLDPTSISLIYAAYRIHSELSGAAMLSMALVAPGSAQMLQIMAHELSRQGDSAGAIANYRAALKVDPNLPGLHFELAEALYNSSDPKLKAEAEGEYKAALAVNQFDEKAESRLGYIAAQRGDLKEAYADDARALELQPNDTDAELDLAKVLMSENKPQQAQKILEHAIQTDPTDYVAHFRLSTIYRQEGKREDAKREIEEYQKYKSEKDKLSKVFQQMRIQRTQSPESQTNETVHK